MKNKENNRREGAGLRSAPSLHHNGRQYRNICGFGKSIRTRELEHAFSVLLGKRSFAQYKLMIFLTGNMDGFVLHPETICERCGIDDKNYREARSALVDRGWITYIKNELISVNYETIYDEYKEYMQEKTGKLEEKPEEHENTPNKTSNLKGSNQYSPILQFMQNARSL